MTSWKHQRSPLAFCLSTFLISTVAALRISAICWPESRCPTAIKALREGQAETPLGHLRFHQTGPHWVRSWQLEQGRAFLPSLSTWPLFTLWYMFSWNQVWFLHRFFSEIKCVVLAVFEMKWEVVGRVEAHGYGGRATGLDCPWCGLQRVSSWCWTCPNLSLGMWVDKWLLSHSHGSAT